MQLRRGVGGRVEHGDRREELIAVVRANLGLVGGGGSDKWAGMIIECKVAREQHERRGDDGVRRVRRRSDGGGQGDKPNQIDREKSELSVSITPCIYGGS